MWLQCDLVLDAAHRRSPEPSIGPRREDIVESIIFKSYDMVAVHFIDVDLNYAKKGEAASAGNIQTHSQPATLATLTNLMQPESYPF